MECQKYRRANERGVTVGTMPESALPAERYHFRFDEDGVPSELTKASYIYNDMLVKWFREKPRQPADPSYIVDIKDPQTNRTQIVLHYDSQNRLTSFGHQIGEPRFRSDTHPSAYVTDDEHWQSYEVNADADGYNVTSKAFPEGFTLYYDKGGRFIRSSDDDGYSLITANARAIEAYVTEDSTPLQSGIFQHSLQDLTVLPPELKPEDIQQRANAFASEVFKAGSNVCTIAPKEKTEPEPREGIFVPEDSPAARREDLRKLLER